MELGSLQRNRKHTDMQNVKKRFFFRCLDAAGIGRIRFHDLRHTFASASPEWESLAYVKEQMEHSFKTTLDVYGHLVLGANRQAVNRLPIALKLGASREAGTAESSCK